MTMRNMTADELVVLNALKDGDLAPLADLLSDEDAGLHPLIHRALRTLIIGDVSQTDFKLFAEQHPDLKDARKSLKATSKNEIRDIEIAKLMAQRGAFRRGCWDAAVEAVMESSGNGKTVVTNAWGRQKAFIRFCIERGHLSVPD